MPISEVYDKAAHELHNATVVHTYRASPLRLPEELWTRLDRISEELGWSRQRLLYELIDEASFDLAALMAKNSAGQIDPDRLSYLAAH